MKTWLLEQLQLQDYYFTPEQTFAVPAGLVLRIKELLPNPKLLCEVGSWLGSSLLHWLKHNPDLTAVAVDTWLGSAEHYLHSPYQAELRNLFEHFILCTVHERSRIVPLRLSSVAAAEFLQKKEMLFDIIYLDAGHKYDEVKLDIESYLPLLNKDGILCGDDWTWDSVAAAVKDTQERFDFANIEVIGNSWILIK